MFAAEGFCAAMAFEELRLVKVVVVATKYCLRGSR